MCILYLYFHDLLLWPINNATQYTYVCFCLLFVVCLGSSNAFFPRGQLPKENLRRSPSTTQATRHPRALSQSLFSLHPYFCHECILHPVRTLPCPIHIPYRVSGLFLPCFSVLHIYSNPTEKNPSTYFKPHKQTMLSHYLNNQNNQNISETLSRLPSCILRAYLFRCPSLTPPTLFSFAV